MAAEAMALLLVGYLSYNVRQLTADYRLTVRNFYGALKVREQPLPLIAVADDEETKAICARGQQRLLNVSQCTDALFRRKTANITYHHFIALAPSLAGREKISVDAALHQKGRAAGTPLQKLH